ncbi:hepatocyte growth factor-regulated tyrosine kinase substrate isoform X2 [Drosophila kikkawai]|nr:hepatocyte growth factor-regulated tyrosine kinase substrate isoform X3 [Drosophila kikkawai]
MTILKAKGHTFPELREADAMFTADTAPNWADGRVCHRCRVEFTFTNRKHHCRNCGQVFCGQCTAKQCPLPKYGIEKEVRVCDGCFAALQRPTSGGVTGGKSAARAADSELPAEYLNSSLSQQVQTPARKTEAELKEEEELQLALALSQSEAEQQKQKQQSLSSAAAAYRMQQRSPSPEAPPVPKEFQQPAEEATNPELAKYLNRSYWEQRKISESSSMASPSAPSPMPPTPQPQQSILSLQPKSADEVQIDEFAANMRTQVEIFVNRMKSNSSRGRSISNDSSVQTLFMTLTSLHSQQLSYIKEMDDKRMWYEQLQDKLTQIKDSRAALDQLRQEHVEKLRRIAEEQERQRQMQMAQKLEIMRKKKQEYLQYQRQLALQRIQEQEREMQLRQEQQKAQYLMGQAVPPFPYLPPSAVPQHGSPSHQLNNVYNPYAAGVPGYPGPAPAPAPNGHGQQFQGIPPGMYNPAMQAQMQQPGAMMQQQPPPPGNAHIMPQPQPQAMPDNQFANNPAILQQGPAQHLPVQQAQQIPIQQPQPQPVPPQQPQLAHVMLQQQHVVQTHPPLANQAPPAAPQAPPVTEIANNQVQAVAAAPAPPQNEPEPSAKAAEPATAELISFD